MSLTIEMHDPAGVILEELASRNVPQASIAITYAFAIAQCGDKADWPKINQAIRERWRSPTALVRIKEAAWQHVDEWERKGHAALDVPQEGRP